MLVRRIVEESGLASPLLARDAGLSVDALWSWTSGRRTPQPESLRQLADGLDRRAEHLRDLARQLREAAE